MAFGSSSGVRISLELKGFFSRDCWSPFHSFQLFILLDLRLRMIKSPKKIRPTGRMYCSISTGRFSSLFNKKKEPKSNMNTPKPLLKLCLIKLITPITIKIIGQERIQPGIKIPIFLNNNTDPITRIINPIVRFPLSFFAFFLFMSL
jgi:hypothetical protein